MAAVTRGSWAVYWGANNIGTYAPEEATIELNPEQEEYSAITGENIYGAKLYKPAVTLMMLKTDVASLKVMLPQYTVADNGTLSTGETVTGDNGAVDVVQGGCTTTVTPTDLVFISCGAPGVEVRLPDMVPNLEEVTLDQNIMKVSIIFTAQHAATIAQLQFLDEGGTTIVS